MEVSDWQWQGCGQLDAVDDLEGLQSDDEQVVHTL